MELSGSWTVCVMVTRWMQECAEARVTAETIGGSDMCSISHRQQQRGNKTSTVAGVSTAGPFSPTARWMRGRTKRVNTSVRSHHGRHPRQTSDTVAHSPHPTLPCPALHHQFQSPFLNDPFRFLLFLSSVFLQRSAGSTLQ